MELGAGRATKESAIDLAVGIKLLKKRGHKVEKEDVLGYIYANDLEKANKAKEDLLENVEIKNEKGKEIPLIYDIVK